MRSALDYYRTVWLVDFEYGQLGGRGGPHAPRCVVGKEIKRGRVVRLWLDGVPAPACPFDLGDDDLYVSFYAPAETACHVALGWPMPRRILDLCAELKVMLNGRRAVMDDYLKDQKIGRASLLGALYHFGLFDVAISAAEKTEMRDLALRGGEYSDDERRALLAYNETDVVALEKLLPVMLPTIDLGPALFRGRYSGNVGTLEHHGIQLNGGLFERLRNAWSEIVERLIDRQRERFDVLKHRDIDGEKFATWLQRQRIGYWPTTPAGQLATGKTAMEEMAKVYGGEVLQLKEYLSAVRQTRLFENLRVGPDGRNRALIGPFGSKTMRNQPSSKEIIWGPSCFVRSLIQPAEGYGMAYLDFSGQEYVTAAYFSGDAAMISDCTAGDPYLGFGKRVGLVPGDATKLSHRAIRDRLKVCCGLGCIYGAGPETVARAGEMTLAEAKRLLQQHRQTYRDFWTWRQCVIYHANLHSEMRTPLGCTWHVNGDVRSTTASNWPMQSAAADQLRLATCLAVEDGVKVVGVLHDAILIEAPLDQLDDATERALAHMVAASRIVLGDGELRVDCKTIRHPGRFTEARGEETWQRLMGLLAEVEG